VAREVIEHDNLARTQGGSEDLRSPARRPRRRA
jgi:hypothetical protein